MRRVRGFGLRKRNETSEKVVVGRERDSQYRLEWRTNEVAETGDLIKLVS